MAASTSASVSVAPPRRSARTVAPAFATASARVLGDPLMRIGVAALEHERDAADDRDHREGRDDEDLASLATTCAAVGPLGVHVRFLGGRGRPALIAHGCFGHWSAVGKSSFGQRYSTLRIDSAVSVTPFPNRKLLMIGVIGW